MSNYTPYQYARKHWLLADDTTLLEPEIESTPQRRRIRIAGEETTHARRDMLQVQVNWLRRQAAARGTTLLLRLGEEIEPTSPLEEQELAKTQVGEFTYREGFEPFRDNSIYSEANWLFKHPSLPIYGRLRIAMQVRPAYGAPNMEVGVSFADTSPINGYYYQKPRIDFLGSSMRAVPQDLLADAVEIVRSNDVPFGQHQSPNSEAVMEAALAAYRRASALDELHIPDLRRTDELSPLEPMTLKLVRPLQPETFRHEMVEFTESISPAEGIVAHWGEIVQLLTARGVSLPAIRLEQALAILLGTGAQPTSLRPYTPGPNGVEVDKSHEVSLNLFDGIVHVNCNHTPRDVKEDVLAYEIARARAEITGESDLFEAFMSSLGQYRDTEDVNKVVKAARHS